MHLTFAAATDRGLVRRANEDQFVARSDLGLFAVVDGMGGHAAGQVASATIADALTSFISDTAGDSDRTPAYPIDPQLSDAANRLQAAIRAANKALADHARRDATLAGGGATLAAVLFAGAEVVVCNVGDCRAYLLRDGTLSQLTRDHSLVAEQVAMGLIDAEEARRHPLRHVVTRAVSGDALTPIDVRELSFASGDRFLLCSDGVHGLLTDAELQAHAAASQPLETVCAGIVKQVVERGAPDNATVIVIEVRRGRDLA